MSFANTTQRIVIICADIARGETLRVACEAVGFAAERMDGEQALAWLKNEKCQLILLSAEPGADTLLAKLRLDVKLSDVPLIVTGAGEQASRVRWYASGATDFLPSPFANEELLHRVKIALELFSARQKLREAEFEFASARATDPVTGLGNFQRLHAVIDYEFGRAMRYQRPLSCAMLADDGVDKLLSSGDRGAADEVLANIAKTIRAEVRNVDRVFRIDFAEFVMVFPETPAGGAKVALDRILASVGAVHSHESKLAAALIALPHVEVKRAEDLFRAVNVALALARKAKQQAPWPYVEFQTFA